MIEIMPKNCSGYRFGRFPRATALALLLALTGCSQGVVSKGIGGPTVTQVDTNELPGPSGQTGTDQGYRYQVGPFDKLIVDVMGVEQLADRKVTVDGSGNITLPIAGVVHVGGLTLGEAVDQLAQQLRAGYVRNPQIAVNLEESVSNFVTVDGQVREPGNYPMISGLTLMRAIAGAKGSTEFAKLKEVVIHRTVNDQKMIALYDLGAIRRGAYADPVLYPNDIIVVGDSPGRRLLQQIVSISPLFISPLIALIDNRN